MNFKSLSVAAIAALMLVAVQADTANANGHKDKPGKPVVEDPVDLPPPPPPPSDEYDGPDLEGTTGTHPTGDPTYSWMHDDVGLAFSYGFNGAGSHLIIVDNHTATSGVSGDLMNSGTTISRGHGYWTSLQASLVAPGAGTPTNVHWDSTSLSEDTTESILSSYSGSGLQVVNLSFGLMGPKAELNNTLGTELWDSLADEAHLGTGVFVKAAGNTNGATVDGTVVMRLPRPTQVADLLNLQLIGASGAIFVGALDGNGSAESPASIASYSTIAGPDTAIQDMFVVAGVDSANMGGLAGTSFAAPIVSGYAAIIGGKFTDLTNLSAPVPPSAGVVVDQLLWTARTDTIADFGASCTQTNSDGSICTRSSVYGVGEADLSRAIAPTGIPY